MVPRFLPSCSWPVLSMSSLEVKVLALTSRPRRMERFEETDPNSMQSLVWLAIWWYSAILVQLCRIFVLPHSAGPY